MTYYVKLGSKIVGTVIAADNAQALRAAYLKFGPHCICCELSVIARTR